MAKFEKILVQVAFLLLATVGVAYAVELDPGFNRFVNSSFSTSSPVGLDVGGTNKSLTATAGAVIWLDADSMEKTAAGSSGQILTSTGTTSPAWVTLVPLANGGTNKAMTVSNGGIVWTDSDSQEVLSAGSSGQLLTSGGAATPAWVTLVPLANGGTNKAMTPSNGGVVWTDADSEEVVAGTATAGLSLHSGSSATPAWGGADVNNGITSYNSTTTMSPSGTTQTVDWSLGNIQYLDMESTSGNLTVTLSGGTNNSNLTLYVQTSTANPTRTITFTGAKWPSGVVPVQSITADAIDVYWFDYIGSTYRGYHDIDSK